MNNLYKSIFTIIGLLSISVVSAQEVRNTNTVKTNTTVNANLNQNANIDQSMEVRAPKKRVKPTRQVDLTMPEKSHNDVKTWRTKGLKQKKEAINTNKVSKMNAEDAKTNLERDFGTYEAYNKRAAVTDDKDWERLNEIVTNKVNLPNESYAIISKKRAELKQDLKEKKINEKEYDLLSQDLDYAENDVKKIETWVGGKR